MLLLTGVAIKRFFSFFAAFLQRTLLPDYSQKESPVADVMCGFFF